MERLISSLPRRDDAPTPSAMLLWAAVPLSLAIFRVAHGIDTSGGWSAEFMAVAIFWTGCLITARYMAATYVYDRLGSANAVTTLRLALAALLIVPVVEPAALLQNAPVIFSIAVTALALDGVAGWLARRTKMTSDFGARVDMEVDALIAALLSLALLQSGTVGAAILLLGFARYAFVLATFVWPWLGAVLPESQRRKAVCVLQIGTLVALLLPVFVDNFATALVTASVLALLYSFTVDILWLAKRR